MIRIQTNFLPNQNTSIHENAFKEIILDAFFINHSYDKNFIQPVGSDKVHDGAQGIWQTNFFVEKSDLNDSMKEILLPIVESEDNLFKDLFRENFFLEVIFVDEEFKRITLDNGVIENIKFISGLKAVAFKISEKGINTELRDNNSKLIIGNIETYESVTN